MGRAYRAPRVVTWLSKCAAGRDGQESGARDVMGMACDGRELQACDVAGLPTVPSVPHGLRANWHENAQRSDDRFPGVTPPARRSSSPSANTSPCTTTTGCSPRLGYLTPPSTSAPPHVCGVAGPNRYRPLTAAGRRAARARPLRSAVEDQSLEQDDQLRQATKPRVSVEPGHFSCLLSHGVARQARRQARPQVVAIRALPASV